MAEIREFYKNVRGFFFIFQATVFKFSDLLGDGYRKQMQNFSKISPK